MKMRGRIERLEAAILPLPSEPPEFIEIDFVDSEKRVADRMVLQVGQVRPAGRRTAQSWPGAKGGW